MQYKQTRHAFLNPVFSLCSLRGIFNNSSFLQLKLLFIANFPRLICFWLIEFSPASNEFSLTKVFGRHLLFQSERGGVGFCSTLHFSNKNERKSSGDFLPADDNGGLFRLSGGVKMESADNKRKKVSIRVMFIFFKKLFLVILPVKKTNMFHFISLYF